MRNIIINNCIENIYMNNRDKLGSSSLEIINPGNVENKDSDKDLNRTEKFKLKKREN